MQDGEVAVTPIDDAARRGEAVMPEEGHLLVKRVRAFEQVDHPAPRNVVFVEFGQLVPLGWDGFLFEKIFDRRGQSALNGLFDLFGRCAECRAAQ